MSSTILNIIFCPTSYVLYCYFIMCTGWHMYKYSKNKIFQKLTKKTPKGTDYSVIITHVKTSNNNDNKNEYSPNKHKIKLHFQRIKKSKCIKNTKTFFHQNYIIWMCVKLTKIISRKKCLSKIKLKEFQEN